MSSAAPMVYRCLRRQMPECFGGDEIALPSLPDPLRDVGASSLPSREYLEPEPMGHPEALAQAAADDAR